MDNILFSKSVQTKLQIFEALETLLKDGRMDDVRVKDVCAVAGVSKTTFYKHFEDKHAVIGWYTDLVHNSGVAQIGRTLSWREGHLITTKGYLAKADVLHAAGQSSDLNSLNPYSKRRREDDLVETIRHYKDIEPDLLMTMQIKALAAGEIELAKIYLAPRSGIVLDTYLDAMVSIVPKSLFDLLDEPVEQRKAGPFDYLFGIGA